jgi:O-acetyl-ADP-ribose deacetylase (regulator of RNase III)
MKLVLVDPMGVVHDALVAAFKGLPDVKVVLGYFEQLVVFDCMVSAANSFGLMDGGVDAAIIRYFGYELMERVQSRILDEYLGEQPVGTCMIVETGHMEHPFIAHTPTMRVPMTIAHTDNVYKAMWAMLLAVRKHNQQHERRIETIACPGLGTLTGQVPAAEAARQMALAYRNFLNPPQSISWQYAEERQARVRYGGDDGLRFSPESD